MYIICVKINKTEKQRIHPLLVSLFYRFKSPTPPRIQIVGVKECTSDFPLGQVPVQIWYGDLGMILLYNLDVWYTRFNFIIQTKPDLGPNIRNIIGQENIHLA